MLFFTHLKRKLLICRSVFYSIIYTFFPLIYIYIYIYIYILEEKNYICIYIVRIRYPDEPFSRLVPDTLSNYRYYFALLSIEHFLHCSLAAQTVFFFFWSTNCVSFNFFQLVWQSWPFLFFQYIFFLWQWFVVYFHLQIPCQVFFTIRAII